MPGTTQLWRSALRNLCRTTSLALSQRSTKTHPRNPLVPGDERPAAPPAPARQPRGRTDLPRQPQRTQDCPRHRRRGRVLICSNSNCTAPGITSLGTDGSIYTCTNPKINWCCQICLQLVTSHTLARKQRKQKFRWKVSAVL